MIPFFDLKRQYEELKKDINPAVLEVLASTQYIGGKYVAELEAQLAGHLGVRHVVSCANGTDAIMLALRACGVRPGDEVITSAFSFFATAEAIAAIGAIPVFIDIRERDLNLDPQKIKGAITPKTKAILPVHIFGQPAAMDEILAIGKEYGLPVVEDAAQAIGARYKDKMIGAVGDITTFSFYPTKNLGAYGDAGMVSTNDDDLAVVLRSLREHGAGKNGARASEILTEKMEILEEQGEGDALYDPYKYFNYIIGYNSRLDAVQAAILSAKLPYLERYNRRRAQIACYYSENIKDCRVPDEVEGTLHCWHQYAVQTEKKYELIEYLNQNGVGAGAFYPVPLHLQKAFAELGYKQGDLPVAERACGQTVCLPIFPELTDDECAQIVGTVNAFFEK